MATDGEAVETISSKPFTAADYANDQKTHLLLAASGSVATIKIPNIIGALSIYSNLSIILLLTESAANFLGGQSHEQPHYESLRSHPNVQAIYLDKDEWKKPWIRNDSILHIELRKFNDIMLIAPLSANTMAKITAGISDNLLTSVVRAWDTTGQVDEPRFGNYLGRSVPAPRRILVAPAMNTCMWVHPVTKKQIAILGYEWGVNGAETEGAPHHFFEVLLPQESKRLACGDLGGGAMKEWTEIVSIIEERLAL
ncbi:flavoprotein [Xylogone sp. PMI_703]|nr:flavoprotein [Xylogone sp. PMI_703]